MRNTYITTSFLLMLFATTEAAIAQSREEDLSALRIVQAKIERERGAVAEPQALSSSLLYRLLGRYYEVGDHWDVAAWVTENPNMIPNAERPPTQGPRVRKGGVFRYEVVAVKGAP